MKICLQFAAVLLLVSIAAGQQTASDPHERVVRQIDDPANGVHWLLVVDDRHPGGPARLVPSTELDAQTLAAAHLLKPVIHGGDRLVIEEHTALVDARLQAKALGPALAGAMFMARLEATGAVLRVRAVSPGLATLESTKEARP